jgi:hypothetical protein
VFAGQREVPLPRGFMYSRAVSGAADSKIVEVRQAVVEFEMPQDAWRVRVS